ncbi:MAG: PEP-CTERM sorting domain-containing protein [Cyanobacteria bacterium J06639_1]
MKRVVCQQLVGAALVAIGTASPAVAQQYVPPSLSHTEIGQYLNIGTGNDQTGDALNVQKIELGADSRFVSDPDPNLRDVFDASGKRRWNSVTNRTYDNRGLPPSAPVFEGIDYSGQSAITSNTGGFTYSNTSVYADGFAVRCASGAGTGAGQCRDNFSSPASSPWITPSGTQGDIGSGNGVVGNFNHDRLIGDLNNAWTFVDSLTAELVISSDLEDGFGSLDIDGIDQGGNGDGLAVIDIDIDGGGDWKLNNYDWILDGTGDVFGIFRVLGDTNMLMSNSSIGLGPGGIGNGSETVAPDSLGALFVQYEEPVGNTDAVFGFNNVILNGVGFWDLNAFNPTYSAANAARNRLYNDMVNTELNIQNGQGCSQFVSSSITFTSSVRWNRCSFAAKPVPEPTSILGGLAALGFGIVAKRRASKAASEREGDRASAEIDALAG